MRLITIPSILNNKEAKIFWIVWWISHTFSSYASKWLSSDPSLFIAKLCAFAYFRHFAIFITIFLCFWIYSLPFWLILCLHWANQYIELLEFDILNKFRLIIIQIKGKEGSFYEFQIRKYYLLLRARNAFYSQLHSNKKLIFQIIFISRNFNVIIRINYLSSLFQVLFTKIWLNINEHTL